MYAFTHQDKGYLPQGGTIPAPTVPNHNKETAHKEMEWLQTHPDSVFLYIKHIPTDATAMQRAVGSYTVESWQLTNWLGTALDAHVQMGPRRHVGFGYNTYRRAVTARIFGVTYHGWYMESSGDYCRLRKAKIQ
jgi:hypothetical protein